MFWFRLGVGSSDTLVNLIGGAVAAGWDSGCGVSTGWAAGLFELSDLDGLTDSIKDDAYDAGAGDAVAGGRRSVRGRGSAVGGWGSTAAVAATESARAAWWGFFFKEDGADLFKELRVDILAFGGLVSRRDGLVAAAAAQATAEAAAEAATTTGGAVVVVAGGGLGASAGYQREGYALGKTTLLVFK